MGIDQADSGYPEEQPGAVGDGGDGESEVRERAGDDAAADRAADNDDGTATGNRRAAGEADG